MQVNTLLVSSVPYFSIQVGDRLVEWAAGVKPQTRTTAKAALGELVRQKWLNLRRTEYTLGVRRCHHGLFLS